MCENSQTPERHCHVTRRRLRLGYGYPLATVRADGKIVVCYWIKTPSQDEHCYSMPVCHPSRIAIVTGQYPFRLGNPAWGTFPRCAEDGTIAHLQRQAGYATAVAGKWQLTLLGDDREHPHRLGFDDYCLFGWHEGARCMSSP